MEYLKNGVSYVGVNDFDRKIFDALLPLPYGTSYNSYLIEGCEKTVLIDTVDFAKSEELLKNLKGVKKIDYIVSNHAEQDHSGSIKVVLDKYPEARVLTTAYCKSMLMDLHHIDETKFELVTENEEVSLGDKTLKFIFTPWAHWPETFSTYLMEDKILFSCDFFGAHFASDELFVGDEKEALKNAKVYFAEIMMPFREILKRNLEKVEELELEIIAPSHGLIHNKPRLILDAYKSWLYDEPKNKVLIPYVSMHGSTEVLVRDLESKLKDNNIEVAVVNLEKEDLGVVAEHLVDSKFLILGVPTLLNEAHPVVTMTASIIRMLKSKMGHVGIIGSYGWGGRAIESIENSLEGLSVEYFEPILIKGLARENDLELITKLVEDIKKIINY
ncbi:MAG: FprA family A-type flavoprotein [Patescibacteria group bacterium]|jgi:flavorubredoxin|nr:FprA family A-type flavoprotein [Patescibacteria group bacterium]